MNESEFQALREVSWRRPLTAEEEAHLQAFLAQHTELQAEWESDASLNHLLAETPPPRLSSNFTAQLLSTIDLEETIASRPSAPRLGWQGWLARAFPKRSWVAAMMVVGLLGVWQYQQYQEKQLHRGMEIVKQAMPPEPKILQDFDAIQRLGQGRVIDEELWAALNQTSP